MSVVRLLVLRRRGDPEVPPTRRRSPLVPPIRRPGVVFCPDPTDPHSDDPYSDDPYSSEAHVMTTATPRPVPGPPRPAPPPRVDPAPRTDAAPITGAQALVRALEEVGCAVVFGIPGGAILPAYDPL